MLGGILLRVLVGVAVGTTAGAAVAGTAYIVYKVLTKKQIKEDVVEQIQNQASEEIQKKIFDIKIKKKIKKGETYSLNDIDEWECAEENTVVVEARDKQRNVIISDIAVTGDEFGDDIRIGSVIEIFD